MTLRWGLTVGIILSQQHVTVLTLYNSFVVGVDWRCSRRAHAIESEKKRLQSESDTVAFAIA